jgi:hypothetical protein
MRRLGGATGAAPASSPIVRATGRVRRPTSCRGSGPCSSPYPLTCPPVTGTVQNDDGAVDAYDDEIGVRRQQALPARGQPDLLVTTGARSELRTFGRGPPVGDALDNQAIRQVDGSGVPRSRRTPGGHQDGHDQELAQPLRSSSGLRKISIVSRRYSRNGGWPKVDIVPAEGHGPTPPHRTAPHRTERRQRPVQSWPVDPVHEGLGPNPRLTRLRFPSDRARDRTAYRTFERRSRARPVALKALTGPRSRPAVPGHWLAPRRRTRGGSRGEA